MSKAKRTADILRKVRALIADPAHWTKETYARNALGRAVRSTAPYAVSWCVMGATRKVTDGEIEDVEAVRTALARAGGMDSIFLNDHFPHEVVLNVCDTAIRQLEEAAHDD